MAFPPAFLEELRARLTVSEVAAKRMRLIKAGREFKALCPFHNEKTPSFTINDDKGFFHCFGCGQHGDVIGLAMRIENLEFREAVERLAEQAGMELPRETPAERARAARQATLHDVVEAACAWFEAQLREPAGRDALAYLSRRGLDEATIRRFRLGYAPERRNALRTALKSATVTDAMLIEAGLLVLPEGGGEPFDFFRGRVMFPIMDARGRPIAFGGRVMGDGQPKYLNSRDTPLFDKGRTLYALDKAREGVRAGAELVVAEGYMDVIALHAAGFRGAVAPLGTALTENQIEALWKLAPEPLLCFDGDAAGQRAAHRAAERALPLLRPERSLRFATLPPGEDPDSLLRSRGAPALRALLAGAKPLVDLVWEAETAGRDTATPERRAALRARLIERIDAIADRTVRSQYWNELIRGRFDNAFRPERRFGREERRRGGRAKPGIAAGPAAPPDPTLRPRALIALLVNHPWLLEAEHETLGRIDLPDQELDSIRRELLHVAGRADALDSDALQSHLIEAGLGAALSRAVSPNLYAIWPCANPRAGEASVREGFRGLVAALEQEHLLAELKAAKGLLATDMTEAALARVEALRRQVLDSQDVGFDEPAGGPEAGASAGRRGGTHIG